MKKWIFLLIAINIILGSVIVGLLYLSETYPLDPGDSFYSIQAAAETWRLRLTARGEPQTNMAINLAERRLADLARAEDPAQIDASVVAFGKALDNAILCVQDMESSPEYMELSFPQFNSLLVKSRLVLMNH